MVLETLPTWELVLIAFLFFLFFLCGAIVLFVILSRMKWNFKVIVLEDVSGSGYVPAMRDRARLISFGDGGEEIFYLKKRKKYRVAYGKRIGKNYIAWAVGKDGYWYNITFENLNKKLMELGISPVALDMRFATASLRKGIENRYNEKTFFEKWGVPIAIGMLILAGLIQAGGMWFVMDKLGEIAHASASASETSERVMILVKDVLSSIDNIQGGSGLKAWLVFSNIF